MKVGEVIDRLNNKEPLALVAKGLGMSPYTLSKKLRLLGYEYDSTQKKRIFIGKGKEPRNQNILDVSSSQPNLNYMQLIYEELCLVRRLLENNKTKQKLSFLPEGERLRRTFSISRRILEDLEAAAEKTGMHKSRLVEAALWEWLQKYYVERDDE